MKITLDESVLQTCDSFAQNRLKDSEGLYRARGEFSTNKIKNDIIVGAAAEFAAKEFLDKHIDGVSEPDLSIHKKKSFSADLVTDDKRFHVKCQTAKSAAKYGLSWLFQKTDKLFKKVQDGKHYLVLCESDLPSVNIKAVLSLDTIKQYDILSAPKVARYAETKVAIYFSDLEKLNIELFEIPESELEDAS